MDISKLEDLRIFIKLVFLILREILYNSVLNHQNENCPHRIN